jgi:xanthine dehydrogenase YagR molybdenum-binding subunit
MTSIGEPITRVDGIAKVTGAAKYAAEFEVPNIAYGVLVTSTIPSGRITGMNVAAARRAPGVIEILTSANAPKLPQGGKAAVKPPAGRVLSLLQDNLVNYNNQPIAVVVAESLEQAIYAGTLLEPRYQTDAAKLDFQAGFPAAHPSGHGKDPSDVSAGKATQGMAEADVKIDQVYTTPMETHNPMEPHATIAQWDGEKLTLHDATQYIPDDNVRVLCPYTGGGFGCKGSTWSHVVLAAMAAKVVNRPVKIVLERPQMFGSVGGRPQTHQHVVIGAKRDGTITAIQHNCISHTSVIEDFTEPSSNVTRMLYASPAIETSQRLVPLNVGTPTFQRAPGESTGTFALEIAMDELAEKLNMDPIQFRLKNYAEKDPTSNKPFSSKNLRQCYEQAAERFGWSKRNPKLRSMKQGNKLIGWGMATATYSANRSAASVRVSFEPTGRVTVACGSQDLGTGTYTIMAQIAAATLKLPIDIIDAKLGDSTMPKSPVSGGSQTSASVGPAVQAAARQAQLALLAAAAGDKGSPFFNAPLQDLQFENGVVTWKGKPGAMADYKEIIRSNGNQAIGAVASAEPDQDAQQYSTHSWGAVFAEVSVDETLGMARARRIVGIYDVGTLLNEKTGKSQLMGGIIWGVSLALHEEAHLDPRTGRIVNNNLAEYHFPVNADIGEIDVAALNIPDTKFNPIGSRGIGEIGITGAAAAVANAIYHATGKRLRSAPITPDQLMA